MTPMVGIAMAITLISMVLIAVVFVIDNVNKRVQQLEQKEDNS